jgi:hypothetical protein
MLPAGWRGTDRELVDIEVDPVRPFRVDEDP